MQRSWRTDGDKITFIVCQPVFRHLTTGIVDSTVQVGVDDAEEKMLGDVNLFISPSEDDPNMLIGELELMIAEPAMQGKGYGKLALMAFLRYVVLYEEQILEDYRAWAGCTAVTDENSVPTDYTTQQWNDNRSERAAAQQKRFGYLRARIGKGNLRSLTLFEHAGFELQSREPNYFGELEMRMYGRMPGDIDSRLATNRSVESLNDSSWKLLKYQYPTVT